MAKLMSGKIKKLTPQEDTRYTSETTRTQTGRRRIRSEENVISEGDGLEITLIRRNISTETNWDFKIIRISHKART